MSERRVGEQFTADGVRWHVYDIHPDGTICSRAAGRIEKPKPVEIDYSRTCAAKIPSSHHRVIHCDDYAVKGSRYCRKHSHVNRYYTES